jgi:nucleoside-diphosphate-sugar epimerase/predicted dehydrogenase
MAIEISPRLAIVGCGATAESGFTTALRRIGWVPSVLIDPSLHRLDSGRVGTISKSLDWQSVVNQFDAALITLPNDLRASTAAALVNAGKHVYIDVPLAKTSEEVSSMIASANRSGVKLSAGFYRRNMLVNRWTKALLQAEILGSITRFEIREGLVFRSDIRSDFMLRPNLAGGGVLEDVGGHTLDLLQWWLGDTESVDYRDDSEGGKEADCIIECRLASGATGRIEFSRTRYLRNSVRIEGERGFIEVHLYKNEVLGGSANALAFTHDGLGASAMKPQLLADLVEAGIKDFRAGASGGDAVGVSVREAVKSVQLIERCYASRRPMPVHPWVEAPAGVSLGAGAATPNMPPGRRVLVTGASGFIGTRLVERLVQQGAVVRGTIRNVERAARVGRLPVELVPLDFSKSDEIDRALDGVDYVFHCAYDLALGHQNVDYLRNLIAACESHAIRRLVHVSSFAVYEPFPDGQLTEQTRDGDRANLYVDTKLDMEKMVVEAAHTRGLAATIVQPSCVYGPFCSVWTNSPVEKLIFGDVILPDLGEGWCNAVYIDDLVDGLVLTAVSPAAVGERFIISGPHPVTWATFFAEMANAVRAGPPKFWPREEIAKASHETVRNIHRAIFHPKRLIKMIIRWYPARRVLLAGLDLMPGSLRMRLLNRYLGSRGGSVGETFLPNAQALSFYSAKATTHSEKAEAKLGYRPCFDFRRGMVLTSQYLQWAYEDVLRPETKV